MSLVHVTHEFPARGDMANYLVQVPFNVKGARHCEQLWTRFDGATHTLCCIPFFQQDLALGDHFSCADGNIKRLPSLGHGVVIVQIEQEPAKYLQLRCFLEALGCCFESYYFRLISIDVPGKRELIKLIDYLDLQQRDRLVRYHVATNPLA